MFLKKDTKKLYLCQRYIQYGIFIHIKDPCQYYMEGMNSIHESGISNVNFEEKKILKETFLHA